MKKTIKGLLQEYDRTYAWLGRKAGVNKQMVYNYANQITVPNVNSAMKIAKVFNLNVEDIDW